jgi:mannitol-1-/sugar-/sorbitol-6-phosphatase
MSMTTIECRGILFDMDGVLVDSTPAVARVWSAWALQHGMEPNDVVRRAHGRPSISTVRELLPDGDHQAENDEIERKEIEDIDGVIALPGAAELLTTLAPDRWAVVTSATRALAEIRIRAGGLPLPKNFVTVDDITHGKPNPEPYLKGAQLLGLAPGACVVMEDAPAGIRAGKAAGARVVALQTTEEDAELLRAGADWIVKDLSAVRIVSSDRAGMLALIL